MIELATNAKKMNEIFNHSEVYPWVKGHETRPIDVTSKLERPDFTGLVDEGGCFLVRRLQQGIYEFHTAVLPEFRGQWAADFFDAGLNWMFTRTDAIELLTQCPRGNRAAKVAVVHANFEYAFSTRPLYPTEDGPVPFDVYSITIQKWAKTARGMRIYGDWFHRTLEDQLKEKGMDIKLHEHDDIHDNYVGIAVRMMLCGLPNKAVSFYNRWALLSSYQPISVISLNPTVIDIFDARLRVGNEIFEVI